MQIQLINIKGLLTISYFLEKWSREHVDVRVLDSVLKLTKLLA